MPDAKITALTAISVIDVATDVLPIVDTSDTSMAISGTTKKTTINQILGASGTATLASATITGNLTVDTNTLFVDSANNFVGVGTTTGVNLAAGRGNLTIGGSSSAILNLSIGAVDTGYLIHGGTDISLVNRTVTGGIIFGVNSTTAMTLNSTGLGVGVTPSGGNRLMIQNTTDCTVVVKAAGANVNSAIDYGSNYGNHTIRKSGTAVWDFGVINDSSATPAFKFSNGTDRLVIDANGNLILQSSATPATLTTNGQLTVNATSNTNLRFSYRGSDGVTRVANITLA